MSQQVADPVVHGVRVVIENRPQVEERLRGQAGLALRLSKVERKGVRFVVVSLDLGGTVSVPVGCVVRAEGGVL